MIVNSEFKLGDKGSFAGALQNSVDSGERAIKGVSWNERLIVNLILYTNFHIAFGISSDKAA